MGPRSANPPAEYVRDPGLSRASQHSEHDALYGPSAGSRNFFGTDPGGLPIKCGVQLRKQYYFDRLSPGKQPLRSAHTTIEKEPAVVASKALFAGFRAARLSVSACFGATWPAGCSSERRFRMGRHVGAAVILGLWLRYRRNAQQQNQCRDNNDCRPNHQCPPPLNSGWLVDLQPLPLTPSHSLDRTRRQVLDAKMKGPGRPTNLLVSLSPPAAA